MDIVLALSTIFFIITLSIIREIFIGYPLFFALITFGFLTLRRGHPLISVLGMAAAGAKKALIVIKVFVLIGMLTALWISAGTIPSIVYYGMELLVADYFILSAFLITSLVSFLLGTSLGTVSTIGVALVVMARVGDINMAMVAGAVMAGAYFGDRCSPMSSSAILVASLTKTDLYTNIKGMAATGILPFIVSAILYLWISLSNPLIIGENTLVASLSDLFHTGPVTLVPALIVLGGALMKMPVKRSMGYSILSAFIISITVQGYSFTELLDFSVRGFHLETGTIPGDILNRGGILSMTKAAVVVSISCAMAGIINNTGIFYKLNSLFNRGLGRVKLFTYTLLTSIATSTFGCNQTIAIVLTQQLLEEAYSDSSHSKNKLAVDIENTAVVIAPLIPWNIAAYIPTTTLGVHFYSYIPYTFYLYLLPLGIIAGELLKQRKK